MKFSLEEAEKAARFVHERTKELALERGFMLYDNFPSWEDLDENMKSLIAQVLAELISQLMIGYSAPPKHGLN